jgi:hypothetical protein
MGARSPTAVTVLFRVPSLRGISAEAVETLHRVRDVTVYIVRQSYAYRRPRARARWRQD